MNSVLIVEDNMDLRFLYKTAIKNEGFRPLTAGDGLEALEILKASTELPKLIILDLMMPNMDGWEFLEERKKYPHLAEIPVIVCSASRERAPANIPFMKKPIELGNLVQILNEYCT